MSDYTVTVCLGDSEINVEINANGESVQELLNRALPIFDNTLAVFTVDADGNPIVSGEAYIDNGKTTTVVTQADQVVSPGDEVLVERTVSNG